MGRRLSYKYILILFFSFSFKLSFAQTLTGKVTDSLGNALTKANILLKEQEDNARIIFKITDDNGIFKTPIKKNTNYTIEIAYLGFTPYKEILSVDEESITKNFTLNKATEKLKEILIESTPAIQIKEDTIHYKVSSFLRGSERNVEDILKNLPGIEVSSDGAISVEGREIEKLMVNNEDFVGKRYRLISKNLRAETIETVDVIDKYLENKLLKDVVDSDDKVINLNLKEEYAQTWFGNLDIGHDILGENYHRLQSNLMNMGGNTKYYLLVNSNNSGLSTGSQSINVSARTGFNPNVSSIAQGYYLFMPYFYSFDDSADAASSRSSKRTTHTGSFNSITNLNKNTKWTNNLTINKNKSKTNQSSFTEYYGDTEVNRTQESKTKNKAYSANLNSRFQAELSASQNIDINADFYYRDGKAKQSNILNDIPINEDFNIESKNYNFRTNYVNRFSEKSIWAINTQMSDFKSPEDYKINDFIYNELFTELNGDGIYQELNNRLQVKAINSILATKQNNYFGYEIRGEFIEKKENLHALVYAIENDNYNLAENFLNKHQFKKQDAHLSIGGQYNKEKIRINLGANAHQVHSSYKSSQKKYKSNFSYIQAYTGLQYTPNDKSNLSFRYNKNFNETPSHSLNSNFFLMNLQFIRKGFEKHTFISDETYALSYTQGKLTDIIRLNSHLSYGKNKSSFSNRIVIKPNYNYTEDVIGKGGYNWNISQSIDYYAEALTSNFNFGISYSKNKTNRALNNNDFNNVYNHNWNYNLNIKSIFSGIFNYKIVGNLSRNVYKSTENQRSTLLNTQAELEFMLSPKLNLNTSFENNNYFTKGIKQTPFLDASLHYKTKLSKKDFHFSLEGRNLLNMKANKQVQVSDYYTSQSSRYLMPRMLLLSVNFGF